MFKGFEYFFGKSSVSIRHMSIIWYNFSKNLPLTKILADGLMNTLFR